MSGMNVQTGFPEPIEGDYLIWSTLYPLPRFMRIIKDEDEHNCHMMWDKNSLSYDNCVLVLRGFNLRVGYQIYPDQWEDTRFVKLPQPHLLDLQEGSPSKPGRYYLYSVKSVRESLDAYYKVPEDEREGLDYLPPGHYIEVIDYHGDLALLLLGETKPMILEPDENSCFHIEIKELE